MIAALTGVPFAQAEAFRHASAQSRRPERRARAAGRAFSRRPRAPKLGMHGAQKICARDSRRRRSTSLCSPPGRSSAEAPAASPPTQLPDEPIAGFQPDLRGLVDARRVLQRLEHLREKPFQPDRAAVAAGQEILAALPGDRVDAVGLRLGAVVLPELRPGERLARETLDEAERRAIAQRRQHGATGEIHADADDAFRAETFDSRGSAAAGSAQEADAIEVERMLQRVVRRR